jgi:hypothetical protein
MSECFRLYKGRLSSFHGQLAFEHLLFIKEKQSQPDLFCQTASYFDINLKIREPILIIHYI